MPTVLKEITPTCRPLNANTPAGAPCIALLAKRTYVLDAYGSNGVPADEQRPLRSHPVYEGDPGSRLLADSEAWPYKLRSDVVVHGHVYAHGAHRQVDAAVIVGANRRDLRVSGDRRCTRSFQGHILFSEPDAFDLMPLGYDRAYGGFDHGSEASLPNVFEMIGQGLPEGTDPKTYSLCAYPRNRHGRGYYLASSRTAVDDLLLPNIEDPSDMLTPERFIVRDPMAWWRQPIPAGTSWMHAGYVARAVYMGVQPFWQPLPDELPEFTRGYLSPEVRGLDVMRGDPWVFGIQNGASLGLQVADLTGGHPVRLVGLHRDRRDLHVVIPPPPRMVVRTRWRAAEPAPAVLHHVELYPDEGVFTVLWRGAVEARRMLMAEELDALPFSVEWPS